MIGIETNLTGKMNIGSSVDTTFKVPFILPCIILFETIQAPEKV